MCFQLHSFSGVFICIVYLKINVAYLYEDFENVISKQAVYHQSLYARSNVIRAELENMIVHQEMKYSYVLSGHWQLLNV